MPRVEPFLVLGESLVDIVSDADGTTSERPGGSPANVAVALARLGAAVALATALGPDGRGDRVLEHLRTAGVGLAGDPVLLPRTSTAVATVWEDGSASYDFDVAGQLSVPGADPRRRHVHAGSIAAVLEPGASAVVASLGEHAATATISYDVNARPAVTGAGPRLTEAVLRVARVADLVKASDEDLAVVFPDLGLDDAVRTLLAAGPAAVILTRGARGASCATAHGRVDVPADTTPVADTIGAGDSFCAALLHDLDATGFLGRTGRPLTTAPTAIWERALRRATSAAALTVSRPGADPPTLAELLAAAPAPV